MLQQVAIYDGDIIEVSVPETESRSIYTNEKSVFCKQLLTLSAILTQKADFYCNYLRCVCLGQAVSKILRR